MWRDGEKENESGEEQDDMLHADQARLDGETEEVVPDRMMEKADDAD